MKKIFLLFVILLLVGCAQPKDVDPTPEPIQQEPAPEVVYEDNQVVEEVVPEENAAPTFNPPTQNSGLTVTHNEPEEQSSFFTSIAEAFAAPETVKCTMIMQDVETTMWIHDENLFSSESVINGQTSFMLYKDPNLYFWSTETDQGMKFNTDDVPAGQQAPAQQASTDPDEIGALASNVRCRNARAPDEVFVLPSDIEFLDFNEMLAGMLS